MANQAKLSARKKASFFGRLKSANQSLLILVSMAVLGGGILVYTNLKGIVSPQEQAKSAALAYLEAYANCDWKKMELMRVNPLPENKKKCKTSIPLPDGQKVSAKELTYGVKKVEYSKEKDPQVDPEGKIESAVVLPSITYKGKDVGGMPMLIMLTRNPDLSDKWLVMSP